MFYLILIRVKAKHMLFMLILYSCMINKIFFVSILIQKCAFLFEISLDIKNNIQIIYYIIISY